MEHNINHKYFEGVNINIPYSADPENRTLALCRLYCQTVRSDLAFAVG